MKIRELSMEDNRLICDIAHLHQEAFPNFFLTQLGVPFLKTLYRGYLENKNSGLIVAEDKGAIIGFIAYSNDYPGFFKELIKHKVIRFAWCSSLAVIRRPLLAKRLLGAFGKSGSVEKPEKYVELASICVDPAMTRQNVGTKMMDYIKAKTDFSVYSFINLETDADSNEYVNQFYRKNGFRLFCTYTTPEGRRMNEYRYYANGVQ